MILPEGLTVLSDFCFSGCGGYNGTLVIPSTLQTVGDHPFGGSSLGCFSEIVNLSECNLYLEWYTGIWYDKTTGQRVDSVKNGTVCREIVDIHENDEVTYESVYFGHYLQEDTNNDGVVNEKDENRKWRR